MTTITSPATGAMLDRLRRLAGPNPEGSKLTDVERLHLIFLLGAMQDGLPGCTLDATIQLITGPLLERGITADHFGEVIVTMLGEGGPRTTVEVVNRIAVHPDLRDPYLD